MFSAFPCARAIPDTPGEPVAASVVRLRDRCCLRPIWRGSASPISVTGLPVGSLALRPVHSLHPGSDGDLTVPFAPPGELHVWTTFYMVSLLSHGERAALHGAPGPPDLPVTS